MKKKLILKTIICAISISALTFGGCKKKDTTLSSTTTTTTGNTSTVDNETQQSATDNAQAEKTFSDVFDATGDAVQQTGGTYKTAHWVLLNGCERVTLDAGTDTTASQWPKKLTLTFGSGTDSCLGKDGRYRKGSIHITLENKRYREAGAKLTAWLENYYVDGFKVEGTKTVTNMGTKTDANGTYIEYSINVTGGKITSPQGKVATWKSTRVRDAYIDANGWPLRWLISGTADGVNFHGVPYNITITNPLVFAPGCKYVEQGTMTITPQNRAAVTVDFGNGACDNEATIIINGKSYTFYMR